LRHWAAASSRGQSTDRRALAAALAAAVLAGCASDTDKIAERLARQQLGAQYLVADVSRENCELSRRLARLGSVGEPDADERCRAAASAEEELRRLEASYVRACRQCASGDRCAASLGRLRESRGRSDEKTACP